MAQRLLEVVLPALEADIDGLLDGGVLVASWPVDTGTSLEGRLVHVAVDAESAEPLLDRLTSRYGAMPGFRVVLLPVEASLPAPQPEERPEASTPAEPRPHARLSRDEIRQELEDGAKLTRRFVALAVLSVAVAAVGLLRDDLAVIIGAMVIAPLLGPNVALALATALGDLRFGRQAFWTNVVGSALVLGLATVIGLVVTVDPSLPALAARTQVDPRDIVLALAAGVAAALSVTSSLSGSVIGVMVAVALMPPLVTAGLMLGSGRPDLAVGGLLLTATNVIGVNLAAVATFIAQGVRPRTWWEAERAKAASRRALALWASLLLLLLVLLAGSAGDVLLP